MKEARKKGVPVNYLVMASLVSLGYSENDAYIVAFPENLALSPNQNKSIRENIITSSKFKDLLSDSVAAVNLVPTEDEALMDKEKTARLIMQAAMKQPFDSKERIEGLMKYSDLMGYKREDVEGDATENIHFYLPLKCSQCPLLKEHNEGRRKPVRPVEMGALLKKEGV